MTGMTPSALMLFAAGLGTRMKELTRDRPKPLVEVADRPLIDHALDLVDQAGVERTVINTHYLAAQLSTHLAGREVALSHEPKLLDTGGGLRQALPLLGPGPVFTLNSDAIWTGPNPLTQLRAAWQPARMDALLLLVPVERAAGRSGAGDFSMDAQGRLTRGGPLVYTGAEIIDPAGLSDMPEASFSLNVLWDRIGAQGRLCGAVHRGGWCDVGSPAGVGAAEALLGQAVND